MRSTVSNGSSWCGPFFETVRSAQPTPAQQTLMRRPVGDRLLDRGRDLRLVGDVALDERRPLAELRRQRLALLRIQVRDRDLRAALVQRACRRLAQPGRASGNDCSASLDPHGGEPYTR